MNRPRDTEALDAITAEIARPAIPIIPLEPKRIPPRSRRRGLFRTLFPDGWIDVMFATMGLFFVSLTVLCGLLTWRLWGGVL